MANVTYPCYWMKRDASSQWYWVYYASNGKAIARSSESYHNSSDCQNSITIMKGSSNSQTYKDA